MTKKDIYNKWGIEYKAGKILAPEFGFINPLLVNGNAKLGKGVYTFSTLAGNFAVEFDYNGKHYVVQGTCLCNCKGCYAQTGFYNMPSVIISNGVKTWLVRNALDWVKRAILAQIEADGIRLCRIHASGDFFSADYVAAWREIVRLSAGCAFWSYTKNPEAENAFSGFDNCNIVKSVIHGFGFNFGSCGYILRVYRALREMGKRVYICRCGIDKSQHCVNCRGCVENEIVLFIEHSTAYKAEQDQLFHELRDIIENQ